MSLSNKKVEAWDVPNDTDDMYYEDDVKEAIQKLKTLGLKKTPYPKYLLLTLDDLKEAFGDALCVEGER